MGKQDQESSEDSSRTRVYRTASEITTELRIKRRVANIVGLVFAFCGIVLVVSMYNQPDHQNVYTTGLAGLVIAAICSGIGSMYDSEYHESKLVVAQARQVADLELTTHEFAAGTSLALEELKGAVEALIKRIEMLEERFVTAEKTMTTKIELIGRVAADAKDGVEGMAQLHRDELEAKRRSQRGR